MHDETDIKEAVRRRYADAASKGGWCCGPSSEVAAQGDPGPAQDSGCACGSGGVVGGSTQSKLLGYGADELAAIPEGADLGLGGGNPVAMLELRPGETVLDLGSGGGIDCFIAARRVGPRGRVIGVDMTPEMIARARRNARAGAYDNVEFRLGEVEHLPVGDASVDAIISNCVINLVPDKRQVFRDAFRVLRPGGRLSVSDIVLLGEVPPLIRDSVDAYVACLSGAVLRDDYLSMLREAGFAVVQGTEARSFELDDLVGRDVVEEFKDRTSATEAELRDVAALFQSVRVTATKRA